MYFQPIVSHPLCITFIHVSLFVTNPHIQHQTHYTFLTDKDPLINERLSMLVKDCFEPTIVRANVMN